MIFINNPKNYFYGFWGFLYISFYQIIVFPHWSSWLLITIILLGFVKFLHYWSVEDAMVTKGLGYYFLIPMALGLLNGCRYEFIYNKTFIIEDSVILIKNNLEYNLKLKSYFYLKKIIVSPDVLAQLLQRKKTIMIPDGRGPSASVNPSVGLNSSDGFNLSNNSNPPVANKKPMISPDSLKQFFKKKQQVYKITLQEIHQWPLEYRCLRMEPWSSANASYQKQLKTYGTQYIMDIFPNHYGLFLGLLLGNKEYFYPYKCLKLLGLSHVTAVSGFHVNIVFFAIFTFVRLIFLPFPLIGHGLGYLLGIIIVILLSFVSGAPSSFRALIMLMVFLLGKILHVSYNKWLIWSLTFIAIHSYNLNFFHNPSFIFSFFIVLAIYLTQNNTMYKTTFLHYFYCQWIINFFITVLSINFFGYFTLFSLFWNIIFIYIFNIIIMLGVFSLMVPFLGCFLDEFIGYFLIVLKTCSKFSIILWMKGFQNQPFNGIVLVLFLLYGVFGLKQISILDLMGLMAVLLLIYYGLFSLIMMA